MTSPAEEDAGHRPTPESAEIARVVLGLLVVCTGIFVVNDALSLRAPAGQSGVGPAAFPIGVGVLLLAGGGALTAVGLWRAVADRRALGAALLRRSAAMRLIAALAVLFGHALLLPLLGFTVSAAALFTGMALLLGNARPWRAVAIGVGLAVLVFVSFTRGIGLSLPIGPWGF